MSMGLPGVVVFHVLSWIGLGLFAAISFGVGVRLVRLHRTNGFEPELLCGLALLGMGPLGFALSMLAAPTAGVSPGLGTAIWALSFAFLVAGSAAAWRFTQRVFRPEHAAARNLVIAVGLGLVACWFVELFTMGFAPDRPGGPAVRVADWLRNIGLVWGAVESLRYHHMLRRRDAIGLGDPEAQYRMFWWAVGTGSAGLLGLVDATARLAYERAFELPWLMLVTAVGGTTAALGIWQAFRRVESTASDPQPVSSS